MPPAQPRLARSAVIGRLEALDSTHGFVAIGWIRKHDPLLYRSLYLHFDGIADARRAAGLAPRRAPRWSLARVIEDVQRLHRAGESTKQHDLLRAGRSGLHHAITAHGGYKRVHQLAGVQSARDPRTRWDQPLVVRKIRELQRAGKSVAATKVPGDLLRGARRCFGSWSRALAAAGITHATTRRARYQKAEVIQRLQALRRAQPALRWHHLTRQVSSRVMRRLFGSVEAALRAARIANWPVRRPSITRAEVIGHLRTNARAGRYAVPVSLRHAVTRLFGSANAARAAAKLPVRTGWTQERLIEALRERARRGDYGRSLHRPCIQLFGSMAAARRAAGTSKGWTPERVIASIRGRAKQGRPVGAALRAACKRRFGSVDAAYKAARVTRLGKSRLLGLIRTSKGRVLKLDRAVRAECRERFGSTEAARLAAGLPSAAQRQRSTRRARADRRFPWRRWSRDTVAGKLRTWHRRGGRMPSTLALACRRQFGSVTRALDALGLPPPKERWTPALIKAALRRAARDGGLLSPSLTRACRSHYGSVTAARVAARVPLLRRVWTRPRLVAELQARMRRGLRGTGPLLGPACVKEFGSREAALRAAAVALEANGRRA